MKKTLRAIYVVGYAVSAIAALRAANSNAPEWFASGIYQGCLFVGLSTAVFWGVSEFVMRLVSARSVHLFLVVTAGAVVIVPAMRLLFAAFYGESVAEFGTWHLLALFTLMHQLFAAVVGGVLGTVGAIVHAVGSRLVRDRSAR